MRNEDCTKTIISFRAVMFIGRTLCRNCYILEWDGGLTADLDVTSDHDGSSYTLVLTFDQEVTLEQWSGTASSTDQM